MLSPLVVGRDTSVSLCGMPRRIIMAVLLPCSTNAPIEEVVEIEFMLRCVSSWEVAASDCVCSVAGMLKTPLLLLRTCMGSDRLALAGTLVMRAPAPPVVAEGPAGPGVGLGAAVCAAKPNPVKIGEARWTLRRGVPPTLLPPPFPLPPVALGAGPARVLPRKARAPPCSVVVVFAGGVERLALAEVTVMVVVLVGMLVLRGVAISVAAVAVLFVMVVVIEDEVGRLFDRPDGSPGRGRGLAPPETPATLRKGIGERPPTGPALLGWYVWVWLNGPRGRGAAVAAAAPDICEPG